MLAIRDGDYATGEAGQLRTLSGTEALLGRVLYRLTARRGKFPLLPRLGSRLYQLPRQRTNDRLAFARQAVAEALAEEEVQVTDVTLSPAGENGILVTALMSWAGTELTAQVEVV